MTFLTDDLIADGVRVACRDRGQGEPVIFIHGTPSHSYEWRNVVPHIERAGYRTIVYDLLGYGRSERPAHRDTSVAAQTDLLESILAELGIDSVNIVAHDIGGAIGQRFAIAYPERVRRLMLIDTVSYDSWPSATWQQIADEQLDQYMNLSRDTFNTMLARQLRMTVESDAAMADEVLDAYLAPHQSTLARASFFEHQVRHYDSRYTREISDRLRALTMPVRILSGENDRWQPLRYAQRLRSEIPDAELIVVPQAGHFVMEDAPEQVTREISEFLSMAA